MTECIISSHVNILDLLNKIKFMISDNKLININSIKDRITYRNIISLLPSLSIEIKNLNN